MKKLLLMGASILLAAGFTACKDDVLQTKEDQPAVFEKEQTYYLAINLMQVGENTRSDKTEDYGEGSEAYNPEQEPNFDEGEDYENKVESVYLIFYDSNGDRVSATENIIEVLTENKTGMKPSNNAIYSGVVEMEARQGDFVPTQAVAIINPISGFGFAVSDDFRTLTSLEKAKRDYVVNQGESSLFAMSKSAYYGKDSEGNMVRLIATPISSNMICNTREEAQAALDEATPVDASATANKEPIDIYVERYAAKVKFSFTPGALNPDKNKKDITLYDPTMAIDEIEGADAGIKINLKFKPEYWAVNAYEKQTFITKSFYTESEDGTLDLSSYADYEYMNRAIAGNQGWSYWNSEQYHRCYWSQSPAYYANRYPRVSDDVLDNPMGYYVLNYYSYNELKENSEIAHISGKARKFDGSGNVEKNEGKFKSDAIYVRENTVSGNALRNAYKDPNASPKAAIGSVIVVGKYEISEGGQPITIEEGDAFYVIGNSDDDYKLFKSTKDILEQYYYQRVNLILSKSSAKPESIFELSDNGLKLQSDYEDLFIIEHPKKEVRGDYILDSRFVTLQFNPKFIQESDHAPLFIRIEDSWVDVADSRAGWNLMSSAGLSRQFTDGMAYFNIPINHLGFYRTSNTNYTEGLSPTDQKFDWTAVRSGDFGIVRNHSYTIEASQIMGLGNAIPDPDTPIVPPTDPEAYFLGARIVVLNWALVPKQTVKL